MKNTLEGINSRITETEEQVSELEDRMVESTAMEQTHRHGGQTPGGERGEVEWESGDSS